MEKLIFFVAALLWLYKTLKAGSALLQAAYELGAAIQRGFHPMDYGGIAEPPMSTGSASGPPAGSGPPPTDDEIHEMQKRAHQDYLKHLTTHTRFLLLELCLNASVAFLFFLQALSPIYIFS